MSRLKSLAYFLNFNKYATQSTYSPTELTFHLDARQRTVATCFCVVSVSWKVMNLSIVQSQNMENSYCC